MGNLMGTLKGPSNSLIGALSTPERGLIKSLDFIANSENTEEEGTAAAEEEKSE